MILLQIYFEILEQNSSAFEKLYHEIYVPALQVQVGYLSSRLLRIFPQSVAHEIGALVAPYNYQIELVFDTEANRRRWVASSEHIFAWGQAEALASRVAHCGYDLIGQNENTEQGEGELS
ncbi:MAG TPA: hypothetical protein VHL11_02865 [Phototrophicaceae bacterium]|jgi:hypothetical protein|nr:hypothetical protein [Phototrophicaceae bacterium]